MAAQDYGTLGTNGLRSCTCLVSVFEQLHLNMKTHEVPVLVTLTLAAPNPAHAINRHKLQCLIHGARSTFCILTQTGKRAWTDLW